MPPSYRQIDYRLRPAKHAERLMLCETLRRLRFHCLEDYQYVGLGSIYFADFRLLHRTLGMTRMFSIEKQTNDAARFEWNRPYAGISMLFGRTEERLSEIDFSLPTIIWLDYDDPLTGVVINDLRTVAHSAGHGSVLVVTVNAQPRRVNESGADMLDQVKAELGASRIPSEMDLESLRGWGLAGLYRRVVDSEIRDALSNANAVRPASENRSFEQIFYFQYEDGAKMVTAGGVFFKYRQPSDVRRLRLREAGIRQDRQ